MAESNAGFMTCELKLDTRSSGWHKTMIKVLTNVKGVSYSIDAEAGIAYVSGTVDPKTLLTVFAKAGKHAQLLRVHSKQHNDHLPPSTVKPVDSYVKQYDTYNKQYGDGDGSSYLLNTSVGKTTHNLSSTVKPVDTCIKQYDTYNKQYGDGYGSSYLLNTSVGKTTQKYHPSAPPLLLPPPPLQPPPPRADPQCSIM